MTAFTSSFYDSPLYLRAQFLYLPSTFIIPVQWISFFIKRRIFLSLIVEMQTALVCIVVLEECWTLLWNLYILLH
jgi:hypothetical protein